VPTQRGSSPLAMAAKMDVRTMVFAWLVVERHGSPGRVSDLVEMARSSFLNRMS